MRAGSVSERKGATAERVKELTTDDVDGIAGGGVEENAREGGFEDDDASTGVEEKFDGYAGVGDETESEEGWRTEERDDLAMDECAAVVGSALDRQDRAIGADDKRLGAEDGDETVITQAGFGQDVLSVGEDDGRGIECGRNGGG